MGIPIFFVLFIIFILVFNFKMRKNGKSNREKLENYYQREERAMSVRKQPLDDLKLYRLDLNKLPFEIIQTKVFMDIEKDIVRLSKLPMASFKGQDNTELKLKYGVANLNTLIQYETTYNLMLQRLVEWSSLLKDEGYSREAMEVLEVGIHLDSDMSQNYLLLLSIYEETNEMDKLKEFGHLIHERNILRKDLVLQKYNVIKKEKGLR
ncbi:hypothetical protein [Vallitalea okinawensis]|uniref:hypothetical protein n=1 Tax=Vallitalea okinawensis TaxID=2078660 RepID=UPI000CFBECC8|nr:hypothetical protein [Vallitalea okinawensis]